MPHLLRRALLRFRDESRGAVATMFALTLIPLVMVVGVAVDYAYASLQRSRLHALADQAALAGILAATDAGASGAAKDSFNARLGDFPGVTVSKLEVTTGGSGSSAGTALSAERVVTLQYAASVPTSLLGIIGKTTVAVSGTVQAAKPLPQYIDFYILVDVSGSMGLAATPQDAQRQFNLTSCAFACHFSGSDSYTTARSQNPPINFRIDAVKYAITNLIADAKLTQKAPGQFRVGVYPFVQCVGTLAAISTDLTAVAAQVGGMPFDDGDNTAMPAGSPIKGAGVLTTGVPSGTDSTNCPGKPGTSLGSGGTRLDNALSVLSKIPKSGDGTSAAKARSFVFLLSDGAQDNSWTRNFNNGNQDTNRFKPLDPNACRGGDANGLTVGVLNTRYLPLTTNLEEAQVKIVNTYISKDLYATAMRQCASWSAYYYEASYASEIDAALNSLFKSAVNATRLTQ